MRKAFLSSIVIFLTGFSAVSAQAAVYKCKDAHGSVTYSQTACPSDENIDKIMRVESSQTQYDVQCGIVKNFAAEVGLAVESGKSIIALAEEFGGEQALPDLAVKIMRSVYEYQSQPYKTVEDAINREGEICLTEEYGAPACADFPVKFITDYGGCATAGHAYQRRQKMAQARTGHKLQSDKVSMQKRVAKASNAARARDIARREREACLSKVDRQIKANAAKAKKAQSASGQDKLRRERRELMSMRGDC